MENISPTRLKVTKLLNSILVLKQTDGSEFFTASSNSIVIGIRNLSSILHFLIMNDIIDHQIIEGILEEYHSTPKGVSNGKTVNKENTNDITIG